MVADHVVKSVCVSLCVTIVFCCYTQLEDMEVMVADHVQKVIKPNFGASWEEVGEENELEDTYALSSMKSLDGESLSLITALRLF